MPPFLHSGHAVTWNAWHLEPSIIGGAFVVAGLYAYSLQFARGFEWWRPALFAAGSALIFLALASPLDAAAHDLLSAHMLQHIVLTTFGRPHAPRPAGGALRHSADGRAALRGRQAVHDAVRRRHRVILNMWFWHVPPVYEAALNNLNVHIAMHIAFVWAAVLVADRGARRCRRCPCPRGRDCCTCS
jgi:cytochrome c oxidase assembly factor CtaG